MSAFSRISLRQLEYYVTVAERGTMAAAAKQCLVSQSAISVAVSQLEKQLGVGLFHREPSRGLILTSAGQQLVAEARRILTQVEDFVSLAQDLGQGLQGHLAVGCAQTLTPYIVPSVLDTFGRMFPGIDVDFVEGPVERLRVLMSEAQCEVSITYWPEPVPGLQAIPLYELRPHLILPPQHRLASRTTVSLADLADDPMILLDSPPSAELFLSIFADAGVVPKVVKRTGSIDTVRALVASGAGYAPLLNRHGFNRAPNGQPFVAAEIEEPVKSVGVHIVVPEGGRLTRRAQAFVEFCVYEFGQMGGAYRAPM